MIINELILLLARIAGKHAGESVRREVHVAVVCDESLCCA